MNKVHWGKVGCWAVVLLNKVSVH